MHAASRRLQAAVLLLAAAALCGLASLPAGARARSAEIAVAQLPPEAQDVLARIRAGGPFPYERDGVAFGNREHLLPAKPHGYYREYTVRTPSARDRGARRIVCGGPPRDPEVCFYTDDHYRSFARIRP